MTQNVFLMAQNDTYNNKPTFSTHLNFSFIQDLIQFHWNVKAHFDQSTGYLEFMQVVQSEQLWGIPEFVGMFVIALGTAVIYSLIRSQFQKLFDERYAALTGFQRTNNQSEPESTISNRNIFDTSTDSKSNFEPNDVPKQNDIETQESSSENSENGKKKLSWEEYKKLEDQE